MKNLLYIQREEILNLHKPVVDSFVRSNFDYIKIRFSSGIPHDEDRLVDWIICPAASWVEPILERAGNLKWVHFQGSGTDQLASFIQRKADLKFTTSQGVNAEAIAEYVVGALLYYAKDFDHFADAQMRGAWERRWLRELSGSTVVVVGTGQIGQNTAKRLRPFGVRLVGLSRSGRPVEGFDETLSISSLDRALQFADALVIAAPLTPETSGLVGRAQLRRLADHAVIVNVARGGIVDEAALEQELRAGRFRGAAFDVFEAEPLPRSSSLWTAPRLMITPHVAGTTQFYLDRMLKAFASAIPMMTDLSDDGLAT